jgi:hypothetical protein
MIFAHPLESERWMTRVRFEKCERFVRECLSLCR